MAEQLGVERGDDVRGPAEPFGFRDEAAAHDVDEIGHVRVDRSFGAGRVVWRLLVRRHVTSGHPRRLETGVVTIGVEVAVRGVPGVARLRRPHPVADLKVTAERDDVGIAHRTAQRGIAVQRRPVDHEVADSGCGVVDFHARRICTLRCPDALRRVGEALLRISEAFAQRELAQPGL